MATVVLTDLTAGPGYIQVDWDNATRPANFHSWRIYHKETADTEWTMIHEAFADGVNYSINSYGWANAVSQDYVAVGVAQDPATGQLTENAYDNEVSIVPAGSGNDYWLVHPTDPTLTVKLRMVTAAPFQLNIDHEAIRLIGRGNKVNTGDDSRERSGSMNFQLFDEPSGRTARQQRQDVEVMYLQGVQAFLRTPFGDLWSVFIETVSIDLISVAGTMEAAEGSLSWVEVA